MRVQQKGTWFGVQIVASGVIDGGTEALVRIIDEAHANPDPTVILWTRNRDEARAAARRHNLAGK